MEKHNIGLTTPEISSLWKTYIQQTATLCVIKHFIQHVQDLEIRPILEEQESFLQSFIERAKIIFNEEHFPIPKGFSNDDLNLSAPALFTDLYGLSFVYRLNQMNLSDYATIVTKVARQDVVAYFYDCMESTAKIYKKSLDLMLLMLSKGVYDRPPKISYPSNVEFIKKKDSLFDTLLHDPRPLNAFELGEIFYIIERNYIGVLLLMGFIQVTKDKEIKKFLIDGKNLAQKQIDIFNKILKEEEHLGNIPVSLEVTDSTISPFSDSLIMFFIATTITTGIYLASYALSASMRKDLAAHYISIIIDIMKYGEEGLKIMVNRGWMEQPPQAFDRVALLKE
ncbi:MAG: putative sugar isomerase [Clostridia bacterium]|nr:putative sugar isomerase [Clostridia bacterium]